MSGRSSLAAALLVVPLLAGPGCTTPDASAEPPDARASSVTTAEVTLLEAGSAPRTPLRLHPKKGDTLSSVLTMEVGMSTASVGTEPKMPRARVARIRLATEVAHVTPDGAFRCDYTVRGLSMNPDPDIPPQEAGEIQDKLDAMEGLSGFTVFDSRGVARQSGVNPPETAIAPEVKQRFDDAMHSLDQICRPFPEEPVGVGARWKVEQSFSTNGMRIHQTTTCTLTALDANGLTLAIALKQSAPEQDVVSPDSPSAKVRLLCFESSGEGELQSSLDRVMPSRGSLTMGSDFQLKSIGDDAPQTLAVKMNIKLSIRSE